MMLLLRAAGILTVVLIHSAYVNAAKEKKECSPYPFVNLEHGQIHRRGYQKYHFVCNRRYVLITPAVVRCFRGNWTSQKEPKCIKREGLCEDPPEIENGFILGEDRDIGSSIRYTCKSGFQLDGKENMICTETGHWDGTAPTCMDETESLKEAAERLNKRFVRELSSQTEDASEGILLHTASRRHGLELVLVIDRSSSVAPIHLENAKTFIIYLIRRFGVRNDPRNQGGTQVALLTFGTDVEIVFNVNNYNITGLHAAIQAVGTIQPNGGGTNIEGALTMVITHVSPHLRKNSKKALVLMTDGVPNIAADGITAEDIAQFLQKEYSFEIFAVGIGMDINRKLLADIASKPSSSHVFILKEYSDLMEIIKIIDGEPPTVRPMSKDQCGYETPHEKSPWQAILYISGGGAPRPMRLSGGILICNQWVLTAASCLLEGGNRIPMKEIFVTLGENDLLRSDPNQTNFYVLDIKLHSKFDPSDPLNNNVALVKLNRLAHTYRPVCLPRTDMIMPLHLNLHGNTSIAGWGLNSTTTTQPSGSSVKFRIQFVPVLLAEEDECPGKKRNMTLICAGQGEETCRGLMGSPLVAVDSATGLNHVIGVLAGRSHCIKGHNQYIELTRYIHWINISTDFCHEMHWNQE